MFKCIYLQVNKSPYVFKTKQFKEELAWKMCLKLLGRHIVRVDPSDNPLVKQCSHDPAPQDPFAVSLINNETDVLWSIK